MDLKLALQHALRNTEGIGSCTACIVSFDAESGLLTGLNLGDSGMLLLRRDLQKQLFVVYKTAPQQSEFNYPFQLGTNSTYTPEDAAPFLFYAKPGDILVMGTDGLFDNMFDADIVTAVTALTKRKAGASADAIAAGLTIRAFNFSIDRKRQSPWQLAAQQRASDRASGATASSNRNSRSSGSRNSRGPWAELQARFDLSNFSKRMTQKLGEAIGELPKESEERRKERYTGGKMDDITCLVARIGAEYTPK